MNNTFQRSDGGRISSHPHEKLDCVVRAFAIACDASYQEAHSTCAALGRKERHKFYNLPALAFDIAARLNKSATLVKTSGTLAEFFREYPKGSYVVRISGHAFAVRNGIELDIHPNGRRCRIRQVWEIR